MTKWKRYTRVEDFKQEHYAPNRRETHLTNSNNIFESLLHYPSPSPQPHLPSPSALLPETGPMKIFKPLGSQWTIGPRVLSLPPYTETALSSRLRELTMISSFFVSFIAGRQLSLPSCLLPSINYVTSTAEDRVECVAPPLYSHPT